MITLSTRRYAAVRDAEAERATRLAVCVTVLALLAALVDRVAAEPARPSAHQANIRKAATGPIEPHDAAIEPRDAPRGRGHGPALPGPGGRERRLLIDVILRAKLAPLLPAGLDVARLYLPASLATATADPAGVTIELPRELRAGRPSIKVIVRGRATWVPVAIAPVIDVAVARRALAAGDILTEDDLAIERRALVDAAAPPATLIGASVVSSIAPGAAIVARDVALPPPLTRGTQVAVDVRRGGVHVRGTGTLELAARPGEAASARLAATRVIVHGRLVAPATLIVGD